MLDHPILEGIREHVVKNLPEYITLGGLLLLACIGNIPKLIPKSAQDWWDWFRNTLQTATPATRAASSSQSHTTEITPTGSIEQTKNEVVQEKK